jgi:hypothetical protein
MARPIYAASRFPRTWKVLQKAQRERIIEIILALPDLLKNPHRHSGFGFRRLQGTFFYEATLDLWSRLILRAAVLFSPFVILRVGIQLKSKRERMGIDSSRRLESTVAGG